MKLKGQTSGAEAIITSVRLVTDNVGTLIGSLYIPDPNILINPKFEAGTKVFRITSSSNNSQIIGVAIATAEEKYFAEGKVNTVQENIIVVRNSRVETETQSESNPETQVGPENVVKSTLIRTIPRPSPASSSRSSSSGSSSKVYNGVATGYITATGSYGTVNQNKGGYSPSGKTTYTQPSIGAAGVARAIASGYPVGQVQAWATKSGARIGPAAAAQYGLRPSDVRLKQNIKTIDNALNRLLNIKL
jgi:hypothetical protein